MVTLGCSKNIYDSEVLMGQLKANNKNVVHEKEGNIVVVNTCGFIDNAKEESINTILDYSQKKENGDIDKLFVTGCLSERYMPDLKKEIPNVDEYFGTTDLPKLLKALKADYKHELIGERLTTTPKNYAYLKISEGCDRPCSFCAIPLMRGKHRSKSIEDLVEETKNLEGKEKAAAILRNKLKFGIVRVILQQQIHLILLFLLLLQQHLDQLFDLDFFHHDQKHQALLQNYLFHEYQRYF